MAHGPVRLKNIQLRFLPFAALALAGLMWLEPRPHTLVLGAGLALIGVCLRSWGAGHLVKTRALIRSGPYSHLRHPLYLGSLACSIGFAVAVAGGFGALLAALVLAWFACAYLPRKEALESDRLERAFGAEFVRYRAAVPAFWPRLEAWRPQHAGGEGDEGRAESAGDEPRWRFDRWVENNELGTTLGIAAAFAVVALRAL